MSVKGKRLKKATVQGNHGPSGGDCEAEEEFQRGDQPLLNDLILETLFGFVRRYDLRACRVVCKKWNLRTIPHMRATFPVTIYGSQSTSATNQPGRRIDDFVELFSTNEFGIPFSKFQLGGFSTTDGVGQQFLQLCGKSGTDMDLIQMDGGKSDVHTIEDVSELLKACPKLEVLALPDNLISRSGSASVVELFPRTGTLPTLSSLKKVTFRAYSKEEKMKCCPTFFEELMTVAPNVSDVSALAQFDGFTNTIVGHVLDVIEKLGRESSIQSLCLVNANIGQIEDLKRMGEKVNGLKLKTLTLVPYIIGNGRDSVQIQLATCFKHSLQHLDVLECVDNVLPQFPCMPQLKALALRPLDDYEPKPINLNHKFPALHTLIMNFEDYGSSNWSLFSSHFEICPTIKSLIVSNLNMEIHTFHDIGRVFPKLTKLSMRVAEDCVEVLRYLWSQMTELESLTIRGYIERKEEMYLDSLFTGIPTQGLQNVRIAVSELVTMTVDERREKILTVLNDHSALPSIRNLMRLRHLDVNVRGGERKQRNNHLTDFTAYLAFYSMDHLKHLNLNQCHLTKTCCEMLTMDLGLETWSFRNLEGKHIIPPFVPDGRENEYN